jgi:hypothetical protein
MILPIVTSLTKCPVYMFRLYRVQFNVCSTKVPTLSSITLHNGSDTTHQETSLPAVTDKFALLEARLDALTNKSIILY